MNYYHPSGNSANATQPRPSTQEPEADRLNPSLQQALTCLDIKLDDELTRYRQKTGQREPNVPQPVTSEETWEQQTVDYDPDSGLVVEPQLKPAISSTTIDEDDYEIIPPSGGFVIIDGMPTPETNFAALATVNYAPISIYGEDPTNHQSLDLNFTPGGQIAPFRSQEYIASSQELLRQIQAGATTPTEGNRPETTTAPTKRQWLTPLKVGSVAAACVIAGAGVYTYLNPSILTPLTATQTTKVATTSTNLGQLIQSPNLAANEFTELNLSTLNTVKIATAAPTTTASTIANPVGTQIATAPAAIPFTAVNPQSIVPPGTPIKSIAPAPIQPRLADSLIQSLLPSNFQTLAKQSQRSRMRTAVKR